MTENLKLQFELEKERIKEKLCPPRNFWSFFKATTYQSTLDLANTPPYITEQFDEFKTYYNKYSFIWFIPLIGWMGYELAIAYKEKKEIFEIAALIYGSVLLLCSVAFIQFLRINLDRKPTIVIDQKGIRIRKTNFYINWQNVVDSYIKTVSRRNSDSEYLIICYYDELSKSFKQIKISLNNLQQKSDKIAYAVELLKMKATEVEQL